jgi:hypothetical protein
MKNQSGPFVRAALSALLVASCGVLDGDVEAVASSLITQSVKVASNKSRIVNIVCAQRCVKSSLGLCTGLWVDDCSLPPTEVTLNVTASDPHPYGAYPESEKTYFSAGCGPKAAQNVMSYFGVPLRIATVSGYIRTITARPFTDEIATLPDDLADGLQDLLYDWGDGFFEVKRRWEPTQFAVAIEIRKELMKGNPVILLDRGGSHFQIVTGIRALVREPASFKDFQFFVTDYPGEQEWTTPDISMSFPGELTLGVGGYEENTFITVNRLSDRVRLGEVRLFPPNTAGWRNPDGVATVECPEFQGVRGLSVATSGTKQPHGLFCGNKLEDDLNREEGWRGENNCRWLDFPAASAGLSSDWAPFYYKWECATGEFIAGAQTTQEGLYKIKCCQPAHNITLPKNLCSTLFVRDSNAAEAGAAFTTTHDWDFGYYKGECGADRYTAGLGRHSSGGGGSALYCCSGKIPTRAPNPPPGG